MQGDKDSKKDGSKNCGKTGCAGLRLRDLIIFVVVAAV